MVDIELPYCNVEEGYEIKLKFNQMAPSEVKQGLFPVKWMLLFTVNKMCHKNPSQSLSIILTQARTIILRQRSLSCQFNLILESFN